MKKLLLVSAFILFFSKAQSQDILDVVAKEVCSCAEEKKEKLQEVGSEKLKFELGVCILTSFSKHKDEVSAEYGSVLEEDEAMENLGRDVGVKMAVVCPDVLMALAELSEDNEGDVIIEEAYSSMEARIVEIKQEQFLTVVVKDNSGRTHTMLLLNFFEGSNLLTEGELKKNDKVSIEYMEQEFYDAKARDFRYYKVIQGIKEI